MILLTYNFTGLLKFINQLLPRKDAITPYISQAEIRGIEKKLKSFQIQEMESGNSIVSSVFLFVYMRSTGHYAPVFD